MDSFVLEESSNTDEGAEGAGKELEVKSGTKAQPAIYCPLWLHPQLRGFTHSCAAIILIPWSLTYPRAHAGEFCFSALELFEYSQ